MSEHSLTHSCGWALIQYEWCLYNRRGLGHRQAQKEDDVKTEEEDSDSQTEEKTFRRSQLCPHLSLGLAASKPLRKYVSVFKAPSDSGTLLWQSKQTKPTLILLFKQGLLSSECRMFQEGQKLEEL